jgi:DNA-directed RNA polymerase specialized sigma54-like protein
MTKLQKHGQELLSEALVQLWEAMVELVQPTFPQTPLPRPPAKGIKVVRQEVELKVRVERNKIAVVFRVDGIHIAELRVSDTDKMFDPSYLLGKMMPHVDSPRALAHCLRQLRWLTAWMRKRAEGRRRAAEEILRQQRRWVEELEGEIALRKLGQ